MKNFLVDKWLEIIVVVFLFLFITLFYFIVLPLISTFDTKVITMSEDDIIKLAEISYLPETNPKFINNPDSILLNTKGQAKTYFETGLLENKKIQEAYNEYTHIEVDAKILHSLYVKGLKNKELMALCEITRKLDNQKQMIILYVTFEARTDMITNIEVEYYV